MQFSKAAQKFLKWSNISNPLQTFWTDSSCLRAFNEAAAIVGEAKFKGFIEYSQTKKSVKEFLDIVKKVTVEPSFIRVTSFSQSKTEELPTSVS